jgi:tripartite-type tricarboxylate transporter receptor subunit TctC
VIEQGFPDFESVAWWGLFAPAGTPAPVIDRFGGAFAASVHDEKVEKEMTEVQMITLSLEEPPVLRKFIADQMRIWSAVIRDNNIRGDI